MENFPKLIVLASSKEINCEKYGRFDIETFA
jgi:hypothetical protein